MGKIEMYQTSGHWEHYKESMYRPIDIDGEMFVLRPMTCPHHFMMYNEEPHSYRDLPVRYAEISSLYRYEKSGELSGLIRLRNFTLADAHNICTEEQVREEFKNALKLVQYMMDTLGISDRVTYRASLHDEVNKEKYIDNPAMWEKSEKLMLEIVDELNLPYYVAVGEAAFYGPKVDVQLTNVMGKEETAFTIQIDYALPDKFDLTYVDSNGDEVRPVVVHRSSIGCLERTMAFLIEHYAGRFPLWLSPVQIEFVSISDNQHEYVKELMDKFKQHEIRCDMNWRDETFSKKLRQARLNLVPYIAIVGDKEMENGQISIRNRDTGKQETYNVDGALKSIAKEIEDKSLELGL
jgi:threonyl-tRNA synthetase